MTLDEAMRDLRETRRSGDDAELIWRTDDMGESFMIVRTINGKRFDSTCLNNVADALSVVNANVIDEQLAKGPRP